MAQSNQVKNTKSDTPKAEGPAVRGIKEANQLSAKVRTLSSAALKLGVVGPGQRRYICTVPAATTIEDVLNEAFFTHVAEQLNPWDEVEVRWADRTRRATFVVHSVGKEWARTFLSETLEMGGTLTDKVPDGYLIDFDGRAWRVVRTDTNAVMKDGFDLEREAFAWLTTHIV